MGKVDIVFVLIFIFVTMTVKTRALPLPDDTKCKAGIYHDFLSAYKFWTKDSPELPIPEIMEQIVCLLHDVKSLKSQVFDLKRKLHRRNRINSTSNK